MIKRTFDFFASTVALVVLSPLLFIAAMGIRLTSPGPVFFRASRAGRGGVPFTMLKFRTMHVQHGPGNSRITGANDSRIFGWGKFLRMAKIDELPQLFNVIAGSMSIVGPRPEDMSIVRDHYTPWMMETLGVRPGMASPGSILASTRDRELEAQGIVISDPETDYLKNFLPLKLAIELVYVRNRSILYDVRVILRTIALILKVVSGKHTFPPPPEQEEAQELLKEFGSPI